MIWVILSSGTRSRLHGGGEGEGDYARENQRSTIRRAIRSILENGYVEEKSEKESNSSGIWFYESQRSMIATAR